ncbi:RNA polymerase sigma factor [soil metagenome]
MGTETRESPVAASDEALIAVLNAEQGKGARAARAFEALYHRHKPFVLRVAVRICGNDEDALDVAQETFVYLLKKFPGFVLTARLTTFLYPAVRHLAIAKAKGRRREVDATTVGGAGRDGDKGSADALEGLPSAFAAGEGVGSVSEGSRENVRAALRRLSPVHREALVLRFVEGLTLEEIALALQTPTGTVKSRLHNALAALGEDAEAVERLKTGIGGAGRREAG